MTTTDETDGILALLIERMGGLYFGKYRGHVTDNADPDNRGRLRAAVPHLLGDEPLGWALPAFTYGGAPEQGFFVIPEVGADVWIEFERGNLDFPVWTGAWFASGAVPESAQPAQKVLKTKSGHKVVLDDDGGSLAITDSNGNSITMDGTVIKVKTGNATKIVIEGPQIELVENAAHPLVFGDSLLQYLNQIVQTYQTHMHPGQSNAGGPVTPAPPVPPMSPATPDLLSVKVKTG
jgi:hypothetical protein